MCAFISYTKADIERLQRRKLYFLWETVASLCLMMVARAVHCAVFISQPPLSHSSNPIPGIFFIIFLFHFLASDSSTSSSLSRTDSLLHLFMPSQSPRPQPQTDSFAWPYAANPCCDHHVPGPCEPSLCKPVSSF